MAIFLLIIILILCLITFVQYNTNKMRSKNLKQIQRKLHDITSNSTNEKVLLFTDDKELIALVNELNQLLDVNLNALANYKKSEQSIKKMISNISHDLKTPLTVVLGYIEMIQLDSEMNEEERSLILSKVHKKTIEVIDLIHKFFDLAKLEAEDKHISMTRVHMNEICRKNILDYYDVLTAKGFTVHIEIPDSPIYALGNLEVLDRILNNLISNAIQHGKDGRTIGLSLRNEEELVYVDIWDRGKGINELYKDRVFERMYTLEDSRNKFYQGSGLGLTITKRLVEKLGGSIQLSSIPYEKTVFSFTLKRMTY
ncbi:sensor histidine kinase [Cytobacillus solani]|uniref:sensor histidine kinase n=1 Tax=Cytobacillus solani TaxID=1637975 RepID=UPI001152E36C|nr:sensor histidine kinase [Cytobacillus solani]USK54590.1 sensor histidine kinase [Cytobacillus solani]